MTTASAEPLPLFEDVRGTAVQDGPYTYLVTRRWAERAVPVVFVMLHPTRADATRDDAVVRRCITLALTWGHGAVSIVNLYGIRATHRSGLWDAEDPVGPHNDEHLQRQFVIASFLEAPVVAAWGTHARKSRVEQVLALEGADRFTCLGTNADGSPVHVLNTESKDRTPWRTDARES